MSDDPVKALGRLARESRREVDPDWDRLTRGELGEAERQGLVEGPEAEVAPAFEPLGDAFADAVTRRLLAGSDRSPAPEGPPRGAEVVPLRRPGARRGLVFAVLLAAAAGLLVVLPGAEAPPLPGYHLEVTGGDVQVRGPAAGEGVPTLRPGSRLEVVARPDEGVTGEVEVGVVVRPEGGEARPWPGTTEVAPGGAVRLVLVLPEDHGLPAGSAMIELSLGRPGGVPTRLQTPVWIGPAR